MSENNKGNMENIVNFYMNSKDKTKAINELATKYELSERRIYQILKDNKCPTPREFKKQEKTKTSVEYEKDVKRDITTTIADKLREYGFKDKEEIERRVNLVKYIQNTTGIDVCEGFDRYLISLIEAIESNQLYSDIETIKKGNSNIFGRYDISNKLQSLVNEEFEEIIENLFQDKKNQENKFSKENKKINDLMTTGMALCMINPTLYRAYCISKGYGDPIADLRKAINIINQRDKPKKEGMNK